MQTRTRRGISHTVAAAASAILVLAGCASGTNTGAKGGSVERDPSTTVDRPTPTSAGDSSSTVPPAPTTASPADGAEGAEGTEQPGDSIDVHTAVPHKGVYRGGKLFLEGDVPSRAIANKIIAKGEAVVGKDNVVDNYRIDPGAPTITDGRVVIDDPLLFASDSIELSPAALDLIPLGVAVMKLNPQVTMRVTGYTDDRGDEGANVVLSTGRALAVVDAMAAQGIDRSRFEVRGKGEADPVATNDNDVGRQANRRIEIILLDLLS